MGTWHSGSYDAAESGYQKSIKSSSKAHQKLIKSSSKVYQFYQKSIKFIRNLLEIFKMARTPLDQHILDLLEKHGEMRSRDIYATKPEISINTIRGRIGKLKNEGKIEVVLGGVRLLPQLSAVRWFFVPRVPPHLPRVRRAALRETDSQLRLLLRVPEGANHRCNRNRED